MVAHPRSWYREYRATMYVLPTSIDSPSQTKEPPPTYPAESTSILPLAGDEIPLSQQGTPAGNKRNDTL